MLKITSSQPTQILHTLESNQYTYKNTLVKIITVFSDKKGAIALVEDENGEIFEVPKEDLK